LATAIIAITLNEETLDRLDRLVRKRAFASRTHAIEIAVREKLERVEHGRLARECAKLNALQEQALAENGLTEGLSRWPPY
jgi:metal-responsive CopG/Arc/MetJ family transcriptional regulator